MRVNGPTRRPAQITHRWRECEGTEETGATLQREEAALARARRPPSFFLYALGSRAGFFLEAPAEAEFWGAED